MCPCGTVYVLCRGVSSLLPPHGPRGLTQGIRLSGRSFIHWVILQTPSFSILNIFRTCSLLSLHLHLNLLQNILFPWNMKCHFSILNYVTRIVSLETVNVILSLSVADCWVFIVCLPKDCLSWTFLCWHLQVPYLIFNKNNWKSLESSSTSHRDGQDL